MSNKVVQLRGANCAGKTTSMRQYLEKAGVDGCISLKTNYGPASATITSLGTIVLGSYKQGGKFGGCDSYKNRDMLVEAIAEALKMKPRGIAFEGLIYSRTVKLATEVARLCQQSGYSYVGVYLHQEYEDALSKVYKRNGGKKINEKVLMGLCAGARSSYEKLKRMGYDMRKVEVAEMPYDRMGDIVYGVLHE